MLYSCVKVYILMSKTGEELLMHFPITIATVPFRIPNSNHQPQICYGEWIFVVFLVVTHRFIDFFLHYFALCCAGPCCEYVEGGMYIGPEFQLGQVYDGNFDPSSGSTSTESTIVLYRPVYLCVAQKSSSQTPKNKHSTNRINSSSRKSPSKDQNTTIVSISPSRSKKNDFKR